MKYIFLLLICLITTPKGISSEDRDILQKEANEIKIEKNLVKEFSEIGFPGYGNRDFWEKLPENIKDQYMQNAKIIEALIPLHGNLNFSYG